LRAGEVQEGDVANFAGGLHMHAKTAAWTQVLVLS
jgi:hypothetical protein